MSLEIAISTATILAEKISDEHEQKISLEITRNILDKFSNGMLNYKKELVHQFQLRSMDNILSQGKLSRHIPTIYFFQIILMYL